MSGFNNFIKLFTPKNKIFYEVFEEVANTVVKMSDLLNTMVQESEPDKRVAILAEIEELEHVNDAHTHQLFTELGRNFITPFDREDIHYLAIALDDIADYIYSAAKKINIYRINPNDTGIYKMAQLIEYGAKQIQIAIHELRNMKNLRKITDALIKINDIENQADDVFDMSIELLFQNEQDFKEVIKKREVYQVLEVATDKCEDASNVIESIIIKYA